MATQYSGISLSELHDLFSHDTWASLSSDQRLQACQEVEDRYAAEKGVAPCLVYKEEMDGFTFGYHSSKDGSHYMAINSHVLDRGEFVTAVYDNDGKQVNTTATKVDGWGWNVLDTVYHEGTHGVQSANGTMHDTYISPGGQDENGRTIPGDYNLYRIGPEEREAFDAGNARTLAAILENEARTGKIDPDKESYMQDILAGSYQSALEAAKHTYGDEQIQETLNQVLQDRDNGIVRDNPSPSYQAISQICDDYDNYLIATLTQANAQTNELQVSTASTLLNDGLEEQDSSPVFLHDGLDEEEDNTVVLDDGLLDCDDAELDGNDGEDPGLSND